MSSDNTLNATLNLTGSGRLKGAQAGSSQTDAFTLGAGDWPALLAAFTTGTSDTPTNGIGEANQWYVAKRSIAHGASDNLDLSGGLTNHLGQTVTLTKVKEILIAILSPDGTKKLRVGPQGVANAWQGPFGGVGATVYKEVFDWEPLVNNKWAGHAVPAGTGDVLGITNPGAGAAQDIDYLIAIFGVQ